MIDTNQQAFNDFLGIKEFEGGKYISYEKHEELIHECNEKQYMIDELKEKLMELKEHMCELPHKPIRAAEMLIDAEYSYKNKFTGMQHMGSLYSKSDLRQIAGHLLLYCNNSEGE